MPCFGVISNLETLLLGLFAIGYYLRRLKMFEDIVASAVQMLMLLFWVTLAFLIIYGALWARRIRKTK
jgi:hypothetical protein